eukprot:6204597-Pleurochrysis_carterae.AAC.2
MMQGNLPLAQAAPIQQAPFPALPSAEPDEDFDYCQSCTADTHPGMGIADTLSADLQKDIPVFDEAKLKRPAGRSF